MPTTVLIIEDNPQNLKLAELVLDNAGYAVLSAAAAEEGLALARERKPALVLMDMQMPGMDGLAATRALRADPATAGIKVLALTALAMRGDEERIRAAGCDAYLAKPFQYRQLLEGVQKLVGPSEPVA